MLGTSALPRPPHACTTTHTPYLCTHMHTHAHTHTLQMLEIHERFECGIPVIIEGETGVGKTALVEMLSILWNQSLLGDWRLLRDRVLTLLQRMCYCELSRCV